MLSWVGWENGQWATCGYKMVHTPLFDADYKLLLLLLLHLKYFQNHLKDGNDVSSSVMWTLLNNKIKIVENINKTNKIL